MQKSFHRSDVHVSNIRLSLVFNFAKIKIVIDHGIGQTQSVILHYNVCIRSMEVDSKSVYNNIDHLHNEKPPYILSVTNVIYFWSETFNNLAVFPKKSRSYLSTIQRTYIEELSQVFLLCLVDDCKHSSNTLAHKAAETRLEKGMSVNSTRIILQQP